MFDFEIQKCTRRCAKTGRELKAGDGFYSILIAEGAELVRRDYALDAWEGPPENAIGWWKSHIPEPSARRVSWAPSDAMLHYFIELEGRDDSQDTRYVLALLMIRRRIVRLEEEECDELGRVWLVLYSPRSETEYRVLVVTPSQERIAEIQAELVNLLFANAA